MPLINGCKYSCEPCIRGHRASSCVHTDRILIEVRKPGRPLESCGHEFSSCQCGKVAALFSVKGFIDGPMLNSSALSDLTMDHEPTFFVEAQPNQTAPAPKQTAISKTGASKAKSHVKGSRVNKNPRTKPQSSSAPSTRSRTSREPSDTLTPPLPSSTEQANQEASPDFVEAPVPPSNIPSTLQSQSYAFEASRWEPPNRETYQPPTHLFPDFSSRIEDVSAIPGNVDLQTQSHILRPQ